MSDNGDRQFLEMANHIGNTLCRDALWHEDRCTWLGWSVAPIKQAWPSVYRSLASDLYGGTSGIALFLAELYQFTLDQQQLRAIDGAVQQMLSVCDGMQGSKRLGFYTGHGGIAYALIRIGELTGRDHYIKHGLQLLENLRDLAPDAKFLDVINGSAGLIPALLSVANHYKRTDFIELATMHGEYLFECAQESESGWSWDTVHHPGQANLTGHSHGAAGIVTAMLEVFRVTGDQKFKHAALEGLRYERHLFNPQMGNWPDLRIMPQSSNSPSSNGNAYYMGWCHGAPGIGLSRLRNVELLPGNVDVLSDLEAAIQTTANSLSPPWVPGVSNYSLCHGAGGNAELLIMAGQRLDRPELTDIAEKVGKEGLQFYGQHGLPWPCGNGGAGESPNLLLGTAGIGHFYLRLHDPKKVNSILIISPNANEFMLSK